MKSIFYCAAMAALLAYSAPGSAQSFPSPPTARATADALSNPYAEEGLNICTVPGACAITFPAVTAKRALILHASCIFDQPAGNAIFHAKLYVQGTTAADYLPIFQYGKNGGAIVYGIHTDVYMFADKGSQPTIEIVGTGLIDGLTCNITGNHT